MIRDKVHRLLFEKQASSHRPASYKDLCKTIAVFTDDEPNPIIESMLADNFITVRRTKTGKIAYTIQLHPDDEPPDDVEYDPDEVAKINPSRPPERY